MSSRSSAAAVRVSFADTGQRRPPVQATQISQRSHTKENRTAQPAFGAGATGEAHAWWLHQTNSTTNSSNAGAANGKSSTRKGRARGLSFLTKNDVVIAKSNTGTFPRTLPPPPLPPKSILVKTRTHPASVTSEQLPAVLENDSVASPTQEAGKPSGLAIRGTRLESITAVSPMTPPPSPKRPAVSPRPAPHIPALPDFTPDLSFLNFDPLPAGLPAALGSAATSSQSPRSGFRLEPSATPAPKKGAKREKRDWIACKKATGTMAFASRPERISSRSDLSGTGARESSGDDQVTPWSQFRPIPEQVPSSPSVSTSSSGDSSDDTSSELFFNPRSRGSADRMNEGARNTDHGGSSTAFILPDLNSPGLELDVRIQRASFVRLSRQPATTIGQVAERIIHEARSTVHDQVPLGTEEQNGLSGGNNETVPDLDDHTVSSSTGILKESNAESTDSRLITKQLGAYTEHTLQTDPSVIMGKPGSSQWQVVSQAEYANLVRSDSNNDGRKEHQGAEESMHLETLAGRAAALERMLLAGKRVRPPKRFEDLTDTSRYPPGSPRRHWAFVTDYG